MRSFQRWCCQDRLIGRLLTIYSFVESTLSLIAFRDSFIPLNGSAANIPNGKLLQDLNVKEWIFIEFHGQYSDHPEISAQFFRLHRR